MAKKVQPHKHWSSHTLYLLASIGCAVGLGNVWKFPYVTGENGGGAFVLVYLLAAFGIGVPLLIAEILLGRRGQMNPIGSMAAVAKEAKASKHWQLIGGMAIVAALIIVSYYVVITGWTVDYFFKAATNQFSNISGQESSKLFSSLLAAPANLIFWQVIVLSGSIWIVGHGLHSGIERAVGIIMPMFFVLLVILVIFAGVAGNFGQAFEFLFKPDFGKLSARIIMLAVGQAFFSITIGVAAMMTYGAYLPKDTSIGRSAVIIVSADTLVAILAGLAIFPIVFAYGLEPSEGVGLIFVTLPVAFGQMPGGQVFGAIFFLFLIAAAVTSCIAVIEPAVAWVVERHSISRRWAALTVGLVVWAVGLGTVFSFNVWSEFNLLDFLPSIGTTTIFEFLDFVSANILLPFGGFLMAIFVGWVMSKEATLDELGVSEGPTYNVWRFVVRYGAPFAIAVVLFLGLAE